MPAHGAQHFVEVKALFQLKRAVERIYRQGIFVVGIRGCHAAIAGGLRTRLIACCAVEARRALNKIGAVPARILRDLRLCQVAQRPVDPVESADRDGILVIEDNGIADCACRRI